MSLFEKIYQDFPMLQTKMNDKRLVYLDSAATTLKPKSVSEAITKYYENTTCNVHRSIHSLSEKTTIAYEKTRDTIHHALNSKHREEIIFTKGTTESLNLLARSLGDFVLKKDDEILLTELEHHSNIVPWQLCAERTGAKIKVLPIDDNGDLDLSKLDVLLSEKTKIFSFSGVSNTLGTINPVKEILSIIKNKSSAYTILDAAQMISQRDIDVQDLDVDFLVFSGHKYYGPTGVGILYGKKDLLEMIPPFHGGGDMIDKVTFEKTTYNDLPFKFEAGTPSIASVIGLNHAFEYVKSLGKQNIQEYTSSLFKDLKSKLSEIEGIKILGNPKKQAPIISFVFDKVSNQDLATLISMDGVAIRTGHHCTQPLMNVLGVSSTARIALSFYNNQEDINILVNSLKKAKEMLS